MINGEKRSFLQSSYLLFFLNVSASTLNYFCQLIMARILSVDSYGTINTIFSLMMIVAVPGSTLTMIVAKYYAEGKEQKRQYLNIQLRNTCVLTALVFSVLYILRDFVSNAITISVGTVLMLAFILAATGYFQPLYAGVLSGCRHFVLVGVYSLFIPLYKIVAIAVSWISTRDDKARLVIILVVMIAGVVLTAIIGHLFAVKSIDDNKKTEEDITIRYSKEEFRTLLLNLSLMFYMNIDLLVVRHYGSDRESGLYSAVLLLGRIVYYFAVTLGTVLLPTVADTNLNDRDGNRILNQALSIIIFFSLVLLIPSIVFRDEIIHLLYGELYSDASIYMVFVAIISLSFSILTIMVNYVVGKGITVVATVVMLIIDSVIILEMLIIKILTVLLPVIGFTGFMGAIIIYLHMRRLIKSAT